MKINEIFYSLQGEGRWAGTPAIFVRFSGCNLKCDFCDTKHQEGKLYTEDDLVREIALYDAKHVILTGGEPTLQITRSFVEKLHQQGKFIHIETNGTKALGDDLCCLFDWITVSPKAAPVCIQRIDELKVIYQGKGQDMARYNDMSITFNDCYYLQPCDVKNEAENARIIAETIEYIKQNPIWKISLQTQKILGVR